MLLFVAFRRLQHRQGGYLQPRQDHGNHCIIIIISISIIVPDAQPSFVGDGQRSMFGMEFQSQQATHSQAYGTRSDNKAQHHRPKKALEPWSLERCS